jgi:hypothetical protein
MTSETIAVLCPTAGAQTGDMPIALRLDRLDGKVLGFLWNTKPNGDVLHQHIRERLAERFHLNDTVWRQKPGAAMSSGPSSESLPGGSMWS